MSNRRPSGWIGACGGDDGGGEEDPQQVVDATFNNEQSIDSGSFDLSLKVEAEGDHLADERLARDHAHEATVGGPIGWPPGARPKPRQRLQPPA